ncbi:DJ-1/PfpI family protein [Rhizobium skierniewicense]|uniref:DJ-1/PfpI family protein n=1 Tax=Rhizobium skierniewicense TaxID=984260 RepID=UPI001FACF218|nr:DJ-1/PfpI family protein [Rhizobium skierniewicense]MCI9868411.1 DJ-1/PfpI family protein [Rhizobium skierniewicense]
MTENVGRPLKVGILIEPFVQMMDIVGVQSVFGLNPNVELHHVGKTKAEVLAWGGLRVAASTTYDECPALDVLAVGAMAPYVYSDPEILSFVRSQARHDPYLIGICAGVLLFGAAGLLRNRRATTNLQCIDRLSEFGCDVVEGGSVVEDGKLFTAGPATGGFEASITALSKIRGVHAAKLQELNIEYHPQPVFGVGSARLAGPELTEEVKSLGKAVFTASADEAALAFRTLQNAAVNENVLN